MLDQTSDLTFGAPCVRKTIERENFLNAITFSRYLSTLEIILSRLMISFHALSKIKAVFLQVERIPYKE